MPKLDKLKSRVAGVDYRTGGKKDGNTSRLAYEGLWQQEGSGGGVGDLKLQPKRKELGRVAGGLIEGGRMAGYRWLYGNICSYNDHIWR